MHSHEIISKSNIKFSRHMCETCISLYRHWQHSVRRTTSAEDTRRIHSANADRLHKFDRYDAAVFSRTALESSAARRLLLHIIEKHDYLPVGIDND